LFSHQLAEKGVELRVEVDEGVPTSLLVDGVRLRQIVLNLVGNAIKFTNQGHVLLRFTGSRSSGPRSTYNLTLLVEDTGMGIPASRMEDIFEPFVQAKANRDAELKGTGLGLAIVKRLVLLMEGGIRAESEEGRGSRFFVDLPEVEISARLAQSTTVVAEHVDFNQLQPSTIFVVDDNPVNLSVLKGYFDSTHHIVHTASNGQEALDWLDSNKADVVLMDIRMPVLDGRTALAQLRAKKGLELLPVIAVTASSMAREEGDLRKMFNGYVRKPFSRTQLFDELVHFIPKQLQDQNLSTVVEDADHAPDSWRALLADLRLMEQQEWPAVAEGMVMSEVLQFAGKLNRLAEAAACPPLHTLAARIQSQAESFSLEELEKNLASFPAFLSQLEQRLPPV
jgi:CheY-like chemotaxis protein